MNTYRLRSNEKLAMGFVYLSALVPLWGILFAVMIRGAWRERSRYVVFHATQAIWAQVGFLLVFIVYAVLSLACNVMKESGQDASALAPSVLLLERLNGGAMIALAFAYEMMCLVLAWLSLDGRNVILPLIGRRIAEQAPGGLKANGLKAGASQGSFV